MKKINPFLIYIIIVICSGLLVIGTLTNGQEWGGDFASYIMQAQSISEHSTEEFIKENWFTITESSYIIGPVAYPWGFPLMLSVIYAIFGANIFALKFIGVISFLAFLSTLWFGFKKQLAPWSFICLVSLLALNPVLIQFADHVMPDLSFLLFSTLSILLIGYLIVEEKRIVSEKTDYMILGTAMAITFFIRFNGILLIPSLIATQLFSYMFKNDIKNIKDIKNLIIKTKEKINKNTLIYLIPYGTFFILLCLYFILLPNTAKTHAKYLHGVSAQSLLDQLNYYLYLPAYEYSKIPYFLLIYGASFVFFLSGILKKVKTQYHIILYITATFLLYLIWPGRQGLRFMFPIAPFYLAFMFAGIEDFIEGRKGIEKWGRRCLTLIPVLFVISLMGYESIMGCRKNLLNKRATTIGPYTQTSEEMFSYIKKHTDKNSTIIFFKPRVMRLMTNRNALVIDQVSNLHKGDYICIRLVKGTNFQFSQKTVVELHKKGILQQTYGNKRFAVFKIINQ